MDYYQQHIIKYLPACELVTLCGQITRLGISHLY